MTELKVFGDNSICNEGTKPNFTLREVNTCYIVKNPCKKQFVTYKVEDGLIPKNSKTLKCDFLLIVQDSDNSHKGNFIELKGGDVIHALEQLDSTLTQLGQKIMNYYRGLHIKYSYSGKVVTTVGVSHKTMGANYKNLMKNLKKHFKQFNGDMEKPIKTPYTHEI